MHCAFVHLCICTFGISAFTFVVWDWIWHLCICAVDTCLPLSQFKTDFSPHSPLTFCSTYQTNHGLPVTCLTHHQHRYHTLVCRLRVASMPNSAASFSKSVPSVSGCVWSWCWSCPGDAISREFTRPKILLWSKVECLLAFRAAGVPSTALCFESRLRTRLKTASSNAEQPPASTSLCKNLVQKKLNKKINKKKMRNTKTKTKPHTRRVGEESRVSNGNVVGGKERKGNWMLTI